MMLSVLSAREQHKLQNIRRRMQWYVDRKHIPCCSYVLAKSGHIIDQQYLGFSDRGARMALTDESIFRIHSLTKLIVSVAAMLLVERGKISLDSPISNVIPGFAELRVLMAHATSIDQTEALQRPVTLRHLLSHTAGFSYGFIDPTTLIDRHYLDNGLNLLNPYEGDLRTFVDSVIQFPIAFQPGTHWRYSVATDIVGYIIECVSGQSLDAFLRRNLFEPLGMTNTGFYVAPEKRHLVVSLAQANDMYRPMETGYSESPIEAAAPLVESPKFMSGGGGLYSTAYDYLNFMQLIEARGMWCGEQIIRRQTLEEMLVGQLPPGIGLKFPMWQLPGVDFGLGFALKARESETPGSIGHYFWGGMAGTHSWVFDNGIVALCMTQMMPSFLHPFSDDFEKLVSQLSI
jgi:CubicO group peptidase (beta-lactamase class C family)